MVTEEEIPWHIKSKLIVMAAIKSRKLNPENQMMLPVYKRKKEYQIYGGKVYFWFNTVLRSEEGLSTHGVHIDLIDGKFPPK